MHTVGRRLSIFAPTLRVIIVIDLDVDFIREFYPPGSKIYMSLSCVPCQWSATFKGNRLPTGHWAKPSADGQNINGAVVMVISVTALESTGRRYQPWHLSAPLVALELSRRCRTHVTYLSSKRNSVGWRNNRPNVLSLSPTHPYNVQSCL